LSGDTGKRKALRHHDRKGSNRATDPHEQKQTIFCLFDPLLKPTGQAYEQAKQAIASRRKILYAPKALTVRVEDRHLVLSLEKKS
jgi:hypothetical protein